MADAVVEEKDTAAGAGESAARVYEVGYVITPTMKEQEVEKIVGDVRSEIGKANGSFIAEGAPSLARLSYAMPALENGKRMLHDRGYFGWIKFDSSIASAGRLKEALEKNEQVMRFIVFRTVREDTRAKMKAPQLREVRRTDTIKSAPRRAEEASGPVSEAELEKALQNITAE